MNTRKHRPKKPGVAVASSAAAPAAPSVRMTAKDDRSAASTESTSTQAQAQVSTPIQTPALLPAAESQPADSRPPVDIRDAVPRKVRDWGDIISIAISLVFVVAVFAITVNLRATTAGVESDVRLVGSGFHWIVQLPLFLLQSLTIVGIICAVLIHLLTSRMWIQAVSASLGLIIGFGLAGLFSFVAQTYASNTLGMVITPLHDWFGSGPFQLFLALAAFLTAAGRRVSRKSIKWSWNILLVLAVLVLVSSSITISSILAAFGLGRIIGLALRFGIGTQSTGIWGTGLVEALREVGIDPVSLHRRQLGTGLRTHLSFEDDRTELSRIYHVVSSSGQQLVVSVSDEQRHTAGYLAQLWQGLKFSGLTIRRDRSVRETAEHHFTMLLALEKAGLCAPRVLGMGESGESVFLIFQAPDTAWTDQPPIRPLDLQAASDQYIAAVLGELKEAHSRGITHRQLSVDCLGTATLAADDATSLTTSDSNNLTKLEKTPSPADEPGEASEQQQQPGQGRLLITGWSHGDLTSTHAHIQVDRVQALAMLAASLGIDRALRIAQTVYNDQELSGIAPFAQNVAVPQATKALPGWNRTLLKQLRERLSQLATTEELGGNQPAELARFNVRKFVSIVLIIVAVAAALTSLNLEEVIDAIENANPWYAVITFTLGIVSWCGSAVAFGVFIDRDMRQWDGIVGTQAVASFAAASMPAGVGPIAINFQHLRKIGYSTTRATAIASADMVSEFGTTFLLFLAIGLFTGQDTLSGALPGRTLIIVIGSLGALIGLAMLIPPLRRWIRLSLLPQLRSYGLQLLKLFSQPAILATSSLGSIVQNGTLALGFWFSLLAFGYRADPAETIFLFLLANAVGSAIPTPGGLGTVEIALVGTFTGIGVPSPIALSATLLFRFCTYWLRIPLGGLYMKYMEKHGQL